MSDATDILENVISDVKLSRDEWKARAEAAEAELDKWRPAIIAAIAHESQHDGYYWCPLCSAVRAMKNGVK